MSHCRSFSLYVDPWLVDFLHILIQVCGENFFNVSYAIEMNPLFFHRHEVIYKTQFLSPAFNTLQSYVPLSFVSQQWQGCYKT